MYNTTFDVTRGPIAQCLIKTPQRAEMGQFLTKRFLRSMNFLL
jgi:hypothetical protein